jgi:hypothetical protein
MEAAIREYAIIRRSGVLPVFKDAAAFVGLAAFLALINWGFDAVQDRTHRGTFDLLFLPVSLALWFTFRGWFFPERKSLVLGEDFIEYRAKSRLTTDRRHIRRDRITSLSETREGLWVEDGSKFGKFMLSSILIPARMPEYNEIKETLMRWHPMGEKHVDWAGT